MELEQVKKKLEQHGKTQTDLVQELGINKSTVSLWLSGGREMTKPVKAMFRFYFLYLDLLNKAKK